MSTNRRRRTLTREQYAAAVEALNAASTERLKAIALMTIMCPDAVSIREGITEAYMLGEQRVVKLAELVARRERS